MTVSLYAGRPGIRAHCYAELAVSSPAAAETIAGIHCTDPRRDGQAEWAWINTGQVDPPEVGTNPSTDVSLLRTARLVLGLVTNLWNKWLIHFSIGCKKQAY